MTVIAALVLTLGMAAAQADSRIEAERLAASGAYEDALKRFQAIAAANPDDVAARLWIGRLHLRMGQPRRAAGVFESIVAVDRDNVEALSGLGIALVNSGNWDAAGAALDRAESIAPDRLDVLAAQGRRHAAAGRSTLALAYYGRALAADPDNTQIRALSDSLRAARAHRVTVGGDLMRFDPAIHEIGSGTIGVNARLHDTLRVFAAGELLHSKIGDERETRGGGGIEWLAHPAVQVRAGAFGGGDRWLPSIDLVTQLALRQGRAQWTVTSRYFDFGETDLWMAGPGLAFDVTPRVTLVGQYLKGRTRSDWQGDATLSDNVVLGVHGRPAKRVSGFVEYRHGIDRLEWMTVDRLAATDANTLGFGATFEVTPFVNVGATYDFTDDNHLRIHRGRGALSLRF